MLGWCQPNGTNATNREEKEYGEIYTNTINEITERRDNLIEQQNKSENKINRRRKQYIQTKYRPKEQLNNIIIRTRLITIKEINLKPINRNWEIREKEWKPRIIEIIETRISITSW